MNPLSVDISDHSRFSLLLTVGEWGVRASFVDRHSGRIHPCLDKSWHVDPADVLLKIEDAIYEDTSILDDYTTSILVRPSRMALIHAGAGGQEVNDVADLLDANENKDVWTEPFADSSTLLYTTPGGVRDFLSRTFPTEDVHMALLPVYAYVRPVAGQGVKAYVHLDNNTLDIIVISSGKPLLLNTRRYCEPADAAYYIVYALRALELDLHEVELHVSGGDGLRAQVMPMLRRHIDSVCGALLPANVKHALNAGISLCEALKPL